ncbi:hypothetical protein GF366_05140, partial [Candidatus Peregrinibacteria bacterium]|nr:hypothetical protein [Candidatus Peregrinibacteria bacterium]
MKKFFMSMIALIGLILPVSQANAAFNYPETINSIVHLSSVDFEENVISGTGFLISADGLILTNAHTVLDMNTEEPYNNLWICLIDNEYTVPDCRYEGEIFAYSRYWNLALISPAYELDEKGNRIGEYIGETENFGLPYVELADYDPSIGDNLS